MIARIGVVLHAWLALAMRKRHMDCAPFETIEHLELSDWWR